MNIIRLPGDVIRFNIFNLLGDFDGHYEFYLNEVTGKYLLHKMGDYGNMVSYRPVSGIPLREPTDAEREILDPIIADRRATLASEKRFHYLTSGCEDNAYCDPHYELGAPFTKHRVADEAAVEILGTKQLQET